MADRPTVAFLGTGIMGAPMARHVAQAGMRVRAWNRTREKAQRLAEDGVEVADAPAEAVRGADVVVPPDPPGRASAAGRCSRRWGQTTRELDEVGQGSRLKLVLNTWLVGVVESLAETISLARALDVDPRDFLDTIEGGGLDCGYAHLKGGLMIEESFEPAAFPLALAAKDAGLVLEAAEQTGIGLPVVAAVREQFARAQDQGLGDADMAAIYRASRPA